MTGDSLPLRIVTLPAPSGIPSLRAVSTECVRQPKAFASYLFFVASLELCVQPWQAMPDYFLRKALCLLTAQQ